MLCDVKNLGFTSNVFSVSIIHVKFIGIFLVVVGLQCIPSIEGSSPLLLVFVLGQSHLSAV
jgi:hypothetical protein